MKRKDALQVKRVEATSKGEDALFDSHNQVAVHKAHTVRVGFNLTHDEGCTYCGCCWKSKTSVLSNLVFWRWFVLCTDQHTDGNEKQMYDACECAYYSFVFSMQNRPFAMNSFPFGTYLCSDCLSFSHCRKNHTDRSFLGPSLSLSVTMCNPRLTAVQWR